MPTRKFRKLWSPTLAANLTLNMLKYRVTCLNQIAMGPNLLAGVDRNQDYKGWNSNKLSLGSVPVETYSRNWIWPRSIFIIGSVWRWNWYCTHINLNNVILWGIIPICKIFAKTWHCLLCFGVRYSFWPFALTRECALHLRPCEKTPETYFADGLAGFLKTICSVPE